MPAHVRLNGLARPMMQASQLVSTHIMLHVQIMLLTALRSSQPGAAQMLEQTAMLVGLPMIAVRWLVRPLAMLLADDCHL